MPYALTDKVNKLFLLCTQNVCKSCANICARLTRLKVVKLNVYKTNSRDIFRRYFIVILMEEIKWRPLQPGTLTRRSLFMNFFFHDFFFQFHEKFFLKDQTVTGFNKAVTYSGLKHNYFRPNLLFIHLKIKGLLFSDIFTKDKRYNWPNTS